jgi:DNA invertase Pin-like site-specific DNA recombinase
MHRDGDPAHNIRANLAYGTRAENMADRDAHGRTARGARNPRSRLTDEAVIDIRNRLAKGEGLRAIGRAFGVSHTTIRLIRNKETWTHVQPH